MPLSPIREQLIGKVKEGPGRDQYRRLMEAIPDNIAGVIGHMKSTFHLRLLKGTQRLEVPSIQLTNEGIRTADGAIADCGAALVKMEGGIHQQQPYEAKRYAGKESGDVHRMKTAYYPQAAMFGLSTEAVAERFFDPALLQPAEGRVIRAKMGDAILEGVLVAEEHNLTEHIRACLAPHEPDVAKIRVLLRHPSFKRISDTVDDERQDIRTLFTDGSQLHVWNVASGQYENQHLSAPLPEDSNRPGIGIKGYEILPMMEDVIGKIHIASADGTFVVVHFADLMPRCKDAQQDPLTGELTKQGNQAKSWRIANRPRVEVGPNKSLIHTAGVAAHVDPASLGKEGKKIINGNATFVIESEKARLRR